MPLPTFDSRDEIPEAFRESYVERNGKFVPDDGFQRQLLDEKKKADAELAKIRQALGDRKPEDIAALLKAQQEAEEERQRKAGEHDKILEKRINETKAEYEKRISELAPYKTKYEDSVLEGAIRKAAIAANVNAKDLEEYVIPLTKGRRITLDEQGKLVVKDKEGDPTGLTVEKFFAETFKAESPKFYEGTGGSGGGATAGTGGKVGPGGTIKITDAAGLLANLDKVAKGEVKMAQ